MPEGNSRGDELLVLRANREVFGKLISAGRLRFVMICDGEEVLSISSDPLTSAITVSGADGSQIAQVFKNTEHDIEFSVEHLHILVQPGMDSVLVTLCALGAILLGGFELGGTSV